MAQAPLPLTLKSFKSAILFEPARIAEPHSWVGHIPFASWLLSLLRPRTFVELGTHSGNSYFAFCQAIQESKLGASAFAVDTWEGDDHAGCYGGEVFRDVKRHNDRHYNDFSVLLRMTFDEALEKFSDRSVDLLHIDGLHTYEAVSHDFHSWLPKLSARAVVLFHDTHVDNPSFGVSKLWSNLRSKYPGFNFQHSNGLGVLLVGEDRSRDLLELDDSQHNSGCWPVAESLFCALGERLQGRLAISQLRTNLNDHRLEIDRLTELTGECRLEIDRLTELAGEHQLEIDRLTELAGEHQLEIDRLTRILIEQQAEIVRLENLPYGEAEQSPSSYRASCSSMDR